MEYIDRHPRLGRRTQPDLDSTVGDMMHIEVPKPWLGDGKWGVQGITTSRRVPYCFLRRLVDPMTKSLNDGRTKR